MRIMRNPTTPLTYVVFILLFLLVGCAQPTPIVIFVTPTPLDGGITPPETSTEATATTVAVLPTDLVMQPTETPIPPPIDAAVSTDPTATIIPGATVTFIGPIVGQGYQVPPSSTPVPTVTPEVQPTQALVSTEPPPATDVQANATPTRISGTPLPSLDTSDVGIQTLSFLTVEDLEQVKNQVDQDLQLGWIKVQVAWDFYQPDGPGQTNQELRSLEIFIEQIRQLRQVKVLVSVAKAPDWARSDLTEDGPPDDPQQLADFITLLLTETNGSIDAVEVWNEPNLAREWRGQPLSGASYMRYFDAGYNAVKAYDPNVVVVTAGLAPTANTEFSRDDRQYLQEIYANGLTRYSGIAVGIHPYGWGNSPDARCCDLSDERGWDDARQFFFLDTIEDYRNIMVANGHGDVQMWATEFGWATWEGLPGEPPDLWMTYNSKWDQANYALRAIQIMQSMDYMGPMFLWNLNFAQPILIDQRDERVAYSIVLPEGAPRERPLFWMLYDAVRPDESLATYD
jgi:hypothetical protein